MALTEDERDLLNAANKIREFQKTDWWGFLLQFVMEAQMVRMRLAVAEAGGMDGLVRTEFQKGAVYGLGLLRSVFDETLAQAEAIRQREAALTEDDSEAEEEDE